MLYALLALIGLMAGLFGGLLGIGGSVVMIPAMNELFGLHQHQHQAVAMIVNFFLVLPAVWQHARARAIVWRVVRGQAPAAVVAVLAGVALSEAPWFQGRGQVYLSGIFGLFLLYEGATGLVRLFRKAGQDRPFDPNKVSVVRAALLVGLPTGIVAGLLGVGGGIVMVPLQRRLLGVPLRQAIANSATTIIPLSLLGASAKNYAVISSGLVAWWKPLVMAGALIPTAMAAAFVGARLTHLLPIRQVRIAFVVLMLIFAARMGLPALAAL
ncbi:MAG: sulfite exporter TauE/SafE family protein [Planctomycetes bacterium]|nr:sulfite exporter TauE/SafE family protein [Planctomycetota bacterium]